MGVQWIIVSNWAAFQHYRKRTPPWIKLYRSLLDDRPYRELPEAAQAILVDLWLLASENDGRIAYDPKTLEFRLRRARTTLAENIDKLVSAGFVTLSGPAAQLDLPSASATLEQRRGEERESRAEQSRGEGGSTPNENDGKIPGWREALKRRPASA